MCGVGFCLASQPGLFSQINMEFLVSHLCHFSLSLFSFACIFLKGRFVLSPCPFSFLSALAKVDSADSPDSLICVSSLAEPNWAVLQGCLSCKKGVLGT